MKHPFWLINSILVLLLVAVGLFLFFLPSSLPERQSFLPEKEHKEAKEEIPKIDLGKIYINDLFGTYHEMPPEKPLVPEPEQQLPPPPPVQQPAVIHKTPPAFMAPLDVALRGIMISDKEEYNTAILEDTKTKATKNYYMGDTIQDAQLIRIIRNKIILVRSNGQQETLYLDKHDAEIDQLLSPQQDWSLTIKKVDTTQYIISPIEFVMRVHNLAQCIELLNLTSVYRNGENIGCRIGDLANNSFIAALGLKTGDIITHINDIPATTTDNRYDIYKTIISAPLDTAVIVQLMRKTIPVTYTYTLQEIEPLDKTPQSEKTPYDIEEEKKKILERKYHFAPTAQELKKQEAHAMINNDSPRKKNSQRNRNIVMRSTQSEIHVGT